MVGEFKGDKAVLFKLYLVKVYVVFVADSTSYRGVESDLTVFGLNRKILTAGNAVDDVVVKLVVLNYARDVFRKTVDDR